MQLGDEVGGVGFGGGADPAGMFSTVRRSSVWRANMVM